MIAPVENEQIYARRQESPFAAGYTYDENDTAPDQVLVTDTVREAIGRHPIVAIAAASVIGLTAAWLIKRGNR